MTDFAEIENELKKLPLAQPSQKLFGRIKRALADPEISEQKVIRPNRFSLNQAALGFGLAAAAVLLILARVGTNRAPRQAESIAEVSSAPEARPALGEAEGSTSADQFIPAGATQVVYSTLDEGLRFVNGSAAPRRRLRYQTHETLHWRNPYTGESLRVSYPSEEIVLLPVFGQ